MAPTKEDGADEAAPAGDGAAPVSAPAKELPSPAPAPAVQNGETPEQCLRLGWAHGALLTTFEGDTTMSNVTEVTNFAKGGSARIQR